jgi:hypothetical protein
LGVGGINAGMMVDGLTAFIALTGELPDHLTVQTFALEGTHNQTHRT